MLNFGRKSDTIGHLIARVKCFDITKINLGVVRSELTIERMPWAKRS